jgi:hypothetical protein
MIDINKRFWCFAFDTYYPSGGVNDYVYGSNSYEDCLEWYKENSRNYEHFDILDTQTGKIL